MNFHCYCKLSPLIQKTLIENTKLKSLFFSLYEPCNSLELKYFFDCMSDRLHHLSICGLFVSVSDPLVRSGIESVCKNLLTLKIDTIPTDTNVLLQHIHGYYPSFIY